MSSLFKLFTIVEMLLLAYLLDHGVSMRGYLTLFIIEWFLLFRLAFT